MVVTDSYGDLLKEKKRYIDLILELVGKRPRCSLFSKKRPLNIVVIGTMGTGKSAFINSLFAAFSYGRWRQYAISGPSASMTAKTVFNRLYTDFQQIEDYKDYFMPYIIDVAGFPNEDDEKWAEVLQVLFDGRLPSDDTIDSVAEYYENMLGVDRANRDYAKHQLWEKYNKVDPNRIVDRIIIVGSYTENPQSNFIETVKKAARPTGRLTDCQRPDIPIFGALTKKDLTVSHSLAEERKTSYMNELAIDSKMLLSFSNYCDDMDMELDFDRTKMIHPKLDVPILDFLIQVCDPVIKVQNEHLRNRRAPNVTLENETRREPGGTQLKLVWYIALFLINILVAFLSVTYFAQIPITSTEFRSVCLQVADKKINNTVMEKLCDATDGGLSFHYNYIIATVLALAITLITAFLSYIVQRFR